MTHLCMILVFLFQLKMFSFKKEKFAHKHLQRGEKTISYSFSLNTITIF